MFFRMVWGDLEKALQTSRTLHSIHKNIVGKIHDEAGRWAKGHIYHANEPEALFWVNATLMDTAVLCYELFLGELSLEQKEVHYQENMIATMAVFGIHSSLFPKTWTDFKKYMQDMYDGDVLAINPKILEMTSVMFAEKNHSSAPTCTAANSANIFFCLSFSLTSKIRRCVWPT